MSERLKGVGAQEIDKEAVAPQSKETRKGWGRRVKEALRPVFRVGAAGMVMSGAIAPVVDVPGGNVERTDKTMFEAGDDKEKNETPVSQESQGSEYDPSKVYALERVSLTEETKQNIEEYRRMLSVIVEGEGVDASTFSLIAPLVLEEGAFDLPFKYEGERFSQQAESLLGWADVMERADGGELVSGDISMNMVVSDTDVVMALKLNRDMIQNGVELPAGTLFAYDDLNDRPHYLSPLVEGRPVILLNVDQIFLDNLKGSGLPKGQWPGLGTVAIVHGTRDSEGGILLTSIALGDSAFVWIEQLPEGTEPGPQATPEPAPKMSEIRLVSGEVPVGGDSVRDMTPEELVGLNEETERVVITNAIVVVVDGERLYLGTNIPGLEFVARDFVLDKFKNWLNIGGEKLDFEDGDKIFFLYNETGSMDVPGIVVDAPMQMEPGDNSLIIMAENNGVHIVYLSAQYISIFKEKYTIDCAAYGLECTGKDGSPVTEIEFDPLAAGIEGAIVQALYGPGWNAGADQIIHEVEASDPIHLQNFLSVNYPR